MLQRAAYLFIAAGILLSSCAAARTAGGEPRDAENDTSVPSILSDTFSIERPDTSPPSPNREDILRSILADSGPDAVPFGDFDTEILEVLDRGEREPDANLLFFAIERSVSIGPEAIPYLEALRGAWSHFVREKALEALAELRRLPRRGGTLIIGMLGIPPPEIVDPVHEGNRGFDGDLLSALLYRGLLRNGAGGVEADIASSWRIEGATLLLDIGGPVFPDGTPLTEADIADAVSRVVSNARVHLEGGEVRISSALPAEELLVRLASPEARIRRDGPARYASGIGWFVPEDIVWNRLVLLPNDSAPGGRPLIDRIEIASASDPEELVRLLETSRADLILVPDGEVLRLARSSEWADRMLEIPPRIHYLSLAGLLASTDTSLIAAAVDREAIASALFSGRAEAYPSSAAGGGIGGIGPGITIPLVLPDETGGAARAARRVAFDLTRAGLKTEVEMMRRSEVPRDAPLVYEIAPSLPGGGGIVPLYRVRSFIAASSRIAGLSVESPTLGLEGAWILR